MMLQFVKPLPLAQPWGDMGAGPLYWVGTVVGFGSKRISECAKNSLTNCLHPLIPEPWLYVIDIIYSLP